MSSLAAGTAASVAFGETSPLAAPKRGFLSRKPATIWEESLISGNGRMGALVMSQPLNETIILSHERLFLRGTNRSHRLIPPRTCLRSGRCWPAAIIRKQPTSL